MLDAESTERTGMQTRHWLSCLNLPREVLALSQKGLLPKLVTRSLSSCCHLKSAKSTLHYDGKPKHTTTLLKATIEVPAFTARRSASSSSNGPVTFFDPNLQRQDPWKEKPQTDIEKSWLKAHLRSLPHENETLDTPSSTDPAPAKDGFRDDRHERAVRANAQLTLDDEPPKYTTDSQGPLYRDLIIRCTTFDAEGNIQKHSEPVAKNALCAQHNLQPRDLRKIDSRIPNVIPTM